MTRVALDKRNAHVSTSKPGHLSARVIAYLVLIVTLLLLSFLSVEALLIAPALGYGRWRTLAENLGLALFGLGCAVGATVVYLHLKVATET